MARKASSFRPQSEWAEGDRKQSVKSEWDAGGGGGGGGGGGKKGVGGQDPALKALQKKFRTIALAKGRPGNPDYRALFRIFDVDNSGLINRLEFKRGLEKLDIESSRDELRQLQQLIFEGDGDNMISFDEFLKFAVVDEGPKRRKQWEEEDGWEGFDYLTCGFFY